MEPTMELAMALTMALTMESTMEEGRPKAALFSSSAGWITS
jgi:hypothetical protein